MTEHEQLLKKFRDDRGLHEYNHDTFINMITEESREILDADNWNHRVEEMCDFCVLVYNAAYQCRFKPLELSAVTIASFKDVSRAVKLAFNDAERGAFGDAIETMRDCITLNGYDFDKAMLETAKKINSREGAMNTKTLKWEKSKTQDKSTLYTPNYDKCKL